MIGLAFARAAEALVGAPFRLHGRDPVTGIDCIGVIACALDRIGRTAVLPAGYSLRTGNWPELDRDAARLGFLPTLAPLAAGDIWVTKPSPIQLHFGIVCPSGQGLIEAHAGLRRVVVSPLPDPRPGMTCWRLQELMEA